MDLLCNQCSGRLANKAYRFAACDHVACERCVGEWTRAGSGAAARCGACGAGVDLRRGRVAFQVVGGAIPEDQLSDVQSTLLAVAVANGGGALDTIAADLRRFERAQVAWNSTAQTQRAQRQLESAEREWAQRDAHTREQFIELQQHADTLKRELTVAVRSLARTTPRWIAQLPMLLAGWPRALLLRGLPVAC